MNQNQNESLEIQVEEIVENRSQEDKQSLTNTSNMSGDEKKLLFLFTLLFFFEGIPVGFLGTVTLLLIQNNVTLTQLTILNIYTLPYSFKFILAPIADKIFYEPLGKRKSYILFSLISMSLCFFLFGFIQLSQIIVFTEVSYIACIGTLLMLCSALQNISLVYDLKSIFYKNGLIISSLSRTYVHTGASCQQIGQTIGLIYGSFTMINITSPRFRNLILNTNDDIAFLSIEQYCISTGVLILLISIYANSQIHEKYEKMDQNNKLDQIFQVCKDIWKVSQNRNTKILIIYLLLRYLGIGPMAVSTRMKLIQQGFPTEVFSSIQLILTPLKIIMACFVAKVLKRGVEIKFIIFGYVIMIIHSIMQYMLVKFLTELGGYNAQNLSIALGLSVLEDINLSFINCSVGGFILRISNQKMGSSFLIFLTCVGNFGHTCSFSLAIFLQKYIEFDIVVLTGWAFAIAFIVIMQKLLEEVQQAKSDQWEPQSQLNEKNCQEMTSEVCI